MTLVVCALLDRRADTAVRGVWRRLEEAGVPTLASHTHGRHLPHLTWTALRSGGLEDVRAVLESLADAPPLPLHLDALGVFRRSRCWLAPAASRGLVERQEAVVAALDAAGAELHHHYRPGCWLPHVTLAPRLHRSQLATVAESVYAVLPVTATVERTVVVDTADGSVHPLG